MSKADENSIVRSLTGMATEEEMRAVLQWKESSSENAQTICEIEQALVISDLALSAGNFDKKAAWDKINKRRETRNSRQRTLTVIGYAASVIIAIGVSWFASQFYFNRNISKTNVIETPAGSRTMITMEDGTKIWMNAKSKVTYPSHFSGKSREIEMEGEAYFEVKKDKKRPFRIKTAEINIEVLGTSFNVKSYPEEKRITTTLVEGKVAIWRSGNQSHRVDLSPLQKAIYNRTNQSINKSDISAEHLNGITGWMNNKMIFENETFGSIAVKLERSYNAEIVFEDPEISKHRFSGTFEGMSIEQALNALQYASEFKYEIKKNRITIRK